MPKPIDNPNIDSEPRPYYWYRSQQPFQALMFMMPMILLYELGTLLYATDTSKGITRYIYARSLLSDFLELLGATGYYLPGLIVVVVLLAWHVVRRDPWWVKPRLYVGMWIESVFLAMPLFVFAVLLFRQPATQMVMEMLASIAVPAVSSTSAETAVAPDAWQTMLVFSIGAGIYEELLFRLIGIAVLHMILVDVLALPKTLGAVIAVVISALAFALYHFSEHNPFTWSKCIFYTGAGLYFAAVYVLRGFGIVAGTHAIYDVIVVTLQMTGETDG